MKINLEYKKTRNLLLNNCSRLLIVICFLNVIILRSQTYTGTITAPTNSVINSACDLYLCAQVSAPNSYLFCIDSLSGYEITLPKQVTLGQLSFCSKISVNANISSGIHRVYLRTQWYDILDSIDVNVINPLYGHPMVSVTPIIDTIQGVLYEIGFGNLDPAQSYTITSNMQYHSYLDSIVNTIIANVGSSSVSYTFNPPNNDTYYHFITVKSTCYDDYLTSSSFASGDLCYASTYIDRIYGNNNNNCPNGSLQGFIDYSYMYLNYTDTITLCIDFGDGSGVKIDTLTTFNYDSVGPFYMPSLPFSQFGHAYQYPGVYTCRTWIHAANACSIDTMSFFINATNNSCGNLTGFVYNDVNSNCSKDVSEAGILGIEIKLTQGTNVYYAWTDTLGEYSFYNIPSGNYTIEMGNNSTGYIVTCSNSQAHTTAVTSTGTTTENFAINCNGLFDLAVTGISLINSFFPGEITAVLPHVGILNRSCNYNVGGVVKVVLDPCVKYNPIGGANQYGAFTPLPNVIVSASTGDTLIWNVSNINNIGNFSNFNYAAAVATCTNAQVGDTACITVIVLPSNGDADLTNNSFTRCFAIGVAYDPNFKEVSPKGSGTQGYIGANTPELRYTVHFQNTGTASAHNIYVLDTLSANLDMETLEVLSSSHPMQTYLLPNKTVKFMFANIMLPDSTHDEAHSHGYVTYTAKPKAGLSPGSQIKNTGYIYFDYNSPIVTNTTLNTIALVTGANELFHNGLVSIYPNPAKDKLLVNITKNDNSVITLTDILGKEVMQQKVTSLHTELTVSDLQSGIYFVKVNGQTQKVVITK